MFENRCHILSGERVQKIRLVLNSRKGIPIGTASCNFGFNFQKNNLGKVNSRRKLRYFVQTTLPLFMNITYFGHACFLVETTGKRILFDPFIAANPLAESVDIDQIRCDYILLSHGHSDHCADLERIARNNPAVTIVGIWEIHEYYSKMGFKTHPMNIGGWWTFDFGRVKMVQAVHSSSWPNGAYAGDPSGFVLETAEGVLYFAGDTALTMDMQLIPMTCRPLDVAILPIGSNFTMDYQDALIASDFIQCSQIIGAHYDTFGYIQIDHKAATKAFSEKGKSLTLLEIGGQTEV